MKQIYLVVYYDRYHNRHTTNIKAKTKYDAESIFYKKNKYPYYLVTDVIENNKRP